MAASRAVARASSRRATIARRTMHVFIVLLMGNLGAMVDAVTHPDIEYFDPEHLLTGGVTAGMMIVLLGALEVYLSWRTRMEVALRASERRLLESEQIAHLGSFVIALPSGELTRSRALNQILGLGDDEQLDAAGWLNLAHPDEREGLTTWFRSAVLGQQPPLDREFRILRAADGGERWVHVLGVIDFAATSQPVRIAGTLQDISEHKRAELERQVLHEVARSITTTADLGDLLQLMHRSLQRVLDAENFFVALHDPKTGLFGFPYFADQHDTTPPPIAMTHSCTAYVFRTAEPLLLTPARSRQLREADAFELIGSPSRSWMGAPLRTPSRTIGVIVVQHYEKTDLYSERDLAFLAEVANQAAIVIERRQAEIALRKSETELSVILESTADGILAVDRHGKVLKTNQRFAELWRIPPALLGAGDDDALLGQVVDQLVDPAQFLSKVRLLYGTAAEDHDILHFRDGRVFERHSTPILVDGEVAGRVWSFHDATARKRAEAAATTLEAQLQRSQRLESVGLLAGGVAHEFNNLMMVILGNTEFALGKVDRADSLHADLVAVRKAAERSADLTRQLLAFARQQPVAPKSLDVNEMVPGMLAMLQQLIGTDIEVRWQPADGLWQVRMDPSQLDQILTNLVVNARQAIAGAGRLTIATDNRGIDALFCSNHAGVAPGEYVRLTVSDTGVGMNAATLDRIFEPFFTTRDVGKGTGLGLAMVYGAVKQNGGFIMASSEPGEGTTFEIYLPRAADD